MRALVGSLLALALLAPASAQGQERLLDRITVDVYARAHTPDYDNFWQWAHASVPSLSPSTRTQTLDRVDVGARMGIQLTSRWTATLSFDRPQARSADVLTTIQGSDIQTGMVRIATRPLLAGVRYNLPAILRAMQPYATAEAGLLLSRIDGYDRAIVNGTSRGVGTFGYDYQHRGARFAARPSLGLHTTWSLPVQLFAEVGYLFGQVAVDAQLADTITRHPVDTRANAWDVRLGLHVNL